MPIAIGVGIGIPFPFNASANTANALIAEDTTLLIAEDGVQLNIEGA